MGCVEQNKKLKSCCVIPIVVSGWVELGIRLLSLFGCITQVVTIAVLFLHDLFILDPMLAIVL